MRTTWFIYIHKVSWNEMNLLLKSERIYKSIISGNLRVVNQKEDEKTIQMNPNVLCFWALTVSVI